MAYDRDEVLGSTDLPDLADQIIGPHKGHGGATWPCPYPGHGDQTGTTPPASTFRATNGDERWRCHSCGGRWYGHRLGHGHPGRALPRSHRAVGPPRRRGRCRPDRARHAYRRYPATRAGEAGRAQSRGGAFRCPGRGLPVVRQRSGGAALVGRAGPGRRCPASQPCRRRSRPGRPPPSTRPTHRRPGRGAAGARSRRARRLSAEPVLGAQRPQERQPIGALAGPLPRVAEVCLPRPAADPGSVLVSDGIPEALVAAQAGHRAAAVFGAGVADDRARPTSSGASPTNASSWPSMPPAMQVIDNGMRRVRCRCTGGPRRCWRSVSTPTAAANWSHGA